MRIANTEHVLLTSIHKQRVYHYQRGESVKTYVVSTSLRPPSCKKDSLGTPWGLHSICDLIGLGEVEGMVFEGRRPIGRKYWECSREMSQKNLITSRILRLEGMEDGVNRGGIVDSFSRFIYIHGTNHEDKLGQQSSSGCIQLSNKCVVELASKVPSGTHVYIEDAEK